MRTLPLVLLVTAALTTLAQDKPVPPAEAPARMTLPAGFQATLFAGEPEVVQPIAITFDDRGRLWVVECLSYPTWTTKKTGKDRVLIFEDIDGDGRHDTRKVFLDNGANLTGIALGHGGVWLCSLPNLLFIPDRDGDDRPDGPPEVLLDGWSLQCKHNVFNGLTWGPDGWLYGCNGITATSHVGKPGTLDKDRTPMNCGVWRYHPVHRLFEPFAWGTTNPFGLDFDDFGEMFITNCVIHHLWHVIPGAHFERMYGQDLNPHVYRLMPSCADHIHWAGGPWQSGRGGSKHHDFGGGHAHAGCMVYLGDNWPDAYRNGVFMCNIHGNRVNHDRLERTAAGYAARHEKDFLLANDTWFRGLAIKYGPDGGVFLTDWCDTGECHDYEDIRRENGRVFKITYGRPKHVPVELSRCTDAELVRLQLHNNDWHVRHARRLLHERTLAGKLAADVPSALRKLLEDRRQDVPRRLRALWALYVVGGADEETLLRLTHDADPHLRSWAIRLLVDQGKASPGALNRLVDMAGDEPSPFVRLYLASALQRIPLDQRWPIAERLAARGEDAADRQIPLMLWYGIEPLPPADPERALRLLSTARIPLVREFLARRVAAMDDRTTKGGLRPLVAFLARKGNDSAVRLDVLRGLREALRGQRLVAMPEGWPAVMEALERTGDAETRGHAYFLAVLFDHQPTLERLLKAVPDASAPREFRQLAVELLTTKQTPGLPLLLHGLLEEPAFRTQAMRSLASFAHPDTPAAILKHYPSFMMEEKAEALAVLASRPAYALALLEAVEKKQVPRSDFSAVHVRQLQSLRDKEVAARLSTVWGAVRPTAKDKAALIRKYKDFLSDDVLKKADLSNGRQLFAKNCGTCHKLFDEGKPLGPDLTGSQRANLDYILENMIDPSAIVPQDYQITVVMTKGGRVLTGLLVREDDKSITLASQTEQVDLPKSEIAQRARQPQSFMPDGLLDALKPEEVRDLVGYLASPTPPKPAE